MSIPRKMLIFLAVSALLLIFTALKANGSPTYTSANFEIYDLVGAGQSYAQSVASAFESARSTLTSQGVSLAPPCSGSKYNVTLVNLGGNEAGLTRWMYSYDQSGRILYSCIVSISVSPGLSTSLLSHTAYHEMNHVAQLAYVKYKDVLEAYPWYVEASAEGVAGALLRTCGWEPYYFQAKLYASNPYSYSGAASEAYALGAFYNWMISSGYAGTAAAFSNSFSSSTIISSWINSAYINFLVSLAKGVVMCGTSYQPSYQQVALSTSGWKAQVTLNGLSANYFKITVPSPGLITISASGSPKSNLQLNQPFYVSNNTLLLAIVNPTTSQATYQLSINYSPPLLAEIKGGTFYPSIGKLELRLYITYKGAPVDGTVVVNGTSFTSSSGSAPVVFQNITWKTYSFIVEYSGEKTTVTFSLSKPSAQILTPMPLYLTSTAYGGITIRIYNPNTISIQASLLASEPKTNNQSMLEFTNIPGGILLQPGSTDLTIYFRAVNSISSASGSFILQLDPNNQVVVPFLIEPATIKILDASFDSKQGRTLVNVLVQPVSLLVQLQLSGLAGDAPIPLSTYFVGVVTVRLPQYSITLAASPLLVAPNWLLVNVTATVYTGKPCPEYPVYYKIGVYVNSSYLGEARFQCGNPAYVSSNLNISLAQSSRFALTANANPSWNTVIQVVPPRITWKLTEWKITDNGSLVTLLLNVTGPHKYLVLGHQVSNGSFTVERFLVAPNTVLRVDTGFGDIEAEMPEVSLDVRLPEVVIYPGNVTLTLSLNTSALIDATFELSLDGKRIGEVRLSGEGILEKLAEFQPEEPGELTVSVKSWFAGKEKKFFYVKIFNISIDAPVLKLLGEEAKITIIVNSYPPLPLPVNVSISGCESKSFQVPSNTSFTLGYNASCWAVITASILNYSDTRRITWDLLDLYLEDVIGQIGNSPIIPLGVVRGYSVFTNGTRVPARVLVNGLEDYTALEPGEYNLKLSVNYLGCSNSTTVTVFLVPRDTYLYSLKVLEKLGQPSSFKEKLQNAIVTGNWGELSNALYVYSKASNSTVQYDPLARIAYWFFTRWAENGSPSDLSASQWILENELWIYLLVALTPIFALILRRLTRARGKVKV